MDPDGQAPEAGTAGGSVNTLALRAGIALWLISWIPIAVIFHTKAPARQLVWIVQILLGIAGVTLAGKAFFGAAKAVGWRRAPRILWAAFIYGRVPPSDDVPTAEPSAP